MRSPESPMRVTLVMIGITAVALLGLRGSHASEGPWCAVQNAGSGSVLEDCRMRTFEQCRLEVIAGNRGFCKPNARWRGHDGSARSPRLHRRRVHRRP